MAAIPKIDKKTLVIKLRDNFLWQEFNYETLFKFYINEN